jgi:hypothetical protein
VADITPEARVQVDPTYQTRFDALRAHAAAAVAARRTGGQVPWNRPAELAGKSLFDFAALGVPFDRAAANAAGVAAIADPSRPGTQGDVVAAATMIEELAVMERALRSRYTMGRCRAVAHSLARLKGHGDPTGVLAQNAIDAVSQVLEAARNPQ